MLCSNKNLQINVGVEPILEIIDQLIAIIHPDDRLKVALSITKGVEFEIRMSQALCNEDLQSAVEILHAMKDAGYKSSRMAMLYQNLSIEKESVEPAAEVSCFNSQLFAELEAIIPHIVEEWWSDENENYCLLERLTRSE